MPLPQWSVQGLNVKPKKVTYLENFPAHIRNTTTDNYNELLNEFNQRKFYKRQGRPLNASVIRYALPLCYLSLQVYRLFFERFAMPYLSSLNKIQQGGVDMLNVLKTLHEKGSFSCDCILMIDEMYLRRSCTISIRRVCTRRRGRNHYVYGSWIKTVYTFRCPSHSGSHI